MLTSKITNAIQSGNYRQALNMIPEAKKQLSNVNTNGGGITNHQASIKRQQEELQTLETAAKAGLVVTSSSNSPLEKIYAKQLKELGWENLRKPLQQLPEEYEEALKSTLEDESSATKSKESIKSSLIKKAENTEQLKEKLLIDFVNNDESFKDFLKEQGVSDTYLNDKRLCLFLKIFLLNKHTDALNISLFNDIALIYYRGNSATNLYYATPAVSEISKQLIQIFKEDNAQHFFKEMESIKNAGGVDSNHILNLKNNIESYSDDLGKIIPSLKNILGAPARLNALKDKALEWLEKNNG